MKFHELEPLILEWAHKKGILKHGTPVAQMDKTREEIGELGDAIEANDMLGIIDGIGDVGVTLIIQAAMQQLTLEECLAHAWEQIKDRTGQMVDGQFVKDAR